MCVITENKQLQFLSIVTTVYFFCLYFSPSSVPVSSSGIDFTDRTVSPTLVVNQHVYCPPFPVTKETPVSLAIAWIHVQKQIHVQKPLCFCFSLPITKVIPPHPLLLLFFCLPNVQYPSNLNPPYKCSCCSPIVMVNISALADPQSRSPPPPPFTYFENVHLF